jgi:hypothetical protein
LRHHPGFVASAAGLHPRAASRVQPEHAGNLGQLAIGAWHKKKARKKSRAFVIIC